MQTIIKKIVLALFPEFSGQYHLSKFAKVVAISDAPNKPRIADEFRPYYAVDLVALDVEGNEDLTMPRFNSVPLCLSSGGQQSGQFEFPKPGTWVVLKFAYGSPQRPYVDAVLPHDMTLPTIAEGSSFTQHSPGHSAGFDAIGNWILTTYKNLVVQSRNRTITSGTNQENYITDHLEVAGHSKEKIGGSKQIIAMGAVDIQAGEKFQAISNEDMQLASNKEIKIHSKLDTTMTTDETNRQIAAVLAHIESPLVWLGSADTNSVKVLLDLIAVVKDLSGTLASHVHDGPVPVQSGAINGHKSAAAALETELAPIVE